jgi:hypothetical protein
MNISFRKRNKVVEDTMQKLAVELGVSVNELSILAMIRFINNEVETLNIKEELMFNQSTIEKWRRQGITAKKFYNKNF